MSPISFWTICFLFVASCIPQGYTRRRQVIDVEGTVESGSNITNLLHKIILSSENGDQIVVEHKPGQKNVWMDLQDSLQDSVFKYLFGKEERPRGNVKSVGRSGLWSAAQTLISNLAVALANNPDGQAIVQPSIDTDQYSLLQDMRSGRIRGPVHVYGRHAAKSEDSSDSD